MLGASRNSSSHEAPWSPTGCPSPSFPSPKKGRDFLTPPFPDIPLIPCVVEISYLISRLFLFFRLVSDLPRRSSPSPHFEASFLSEFPVRSQVRTLFFFFPFSCIFYFPPLEEVTPRAFSPFGVFPHVSLAALFAFSLPLPSFSALSEAFFLFQASNVIT